MSPITSPWLIQKILVIAKAYPEVSTKDGEIVCTAGITEDGQWRRIYPVPFRDLKPNARFKKWQWIEVTLAKHSDPRLESYVIQPDSINVLEHLDPAKHLNLRKQYINPGVYKSLHELEDKGLTLGAFKPKKVTDLVISSYTKGRTPKQRGILMQTSLFTKKTSLLKEKPLQFTYHFACDDSACKGHEIAIFDWEIYASYFKFLKYYGSHNEAVKKLKEKWLDTFFNKRNTYFIAGTHRRFKTWMLIGYFSLGLYDSLEQFQRSLFIFDKSKS